MPQPRSSSRTALLRLLFLAVVGWALVAFRRRPEKSNTFAPAEHGGTPAFGFEPQPALVRAPRRSRRRRLATSLTFATLFFAGAALSAGAGDMLVTAMEPGAETTDTTTTTEDPAAAEDPGDNTEAPAGDPSAEEPPADDSTSPDGTTTPDDGAPAEENPGETTDPSDGSSDPDGSGETPDDGGAPSDNGGDGAAGGGAEGGSGDGASAPEAPKGPPVIAPTPHADDEETAGLDPEAEHVGGATIWLHRILPDPTPPARRLKAAWARMLQRESSAAGVQWARVLAAIRADGKLGRRPASRATTRVIARRLASTASQGEWKSFLALHGRTAYADRAEAWARYNRAVGLRPLVVGLDASKRTLERKVLDDARISIYAGGRHDIATHDINVRVLVLLRYLAEAHGTVTVSSLHSGHRIYSRPGVVSAHTYGLAADIAALGGMPIYGHSQPGSITEQAVRDILLLPAELRPRQVISLLGLGGPSFPMADHDDHIHVGY